jgi:hypothetical protein
MHVGCIRAGNIADILYGASLLENLERLHMVGQAFYGTLPSNLAFPKLIHMNLGYNYISVSVKSFSLHEQCSV